MERKGNYNNKKIGEEDDFVRVGDNGASVRLQGSSKNISMFTQQGRKGINQDAMTVWEVIISSNQFSNFDLNNMISFIYMYMLFQII